MPTNVEIERCPACKRPVAPPDVEDVTRFEARGWRFAAVLVVAAWCVAGGIHLAIAAARAL
jgi:hypothetical protein